MQAKFLRLIQNREFQRVGWPEVKQVEIRMQGRCADFLEGYRAVVGVLKQTRARVGGTCESVANVPQ